MKKTNLLSILVLIMSPAYAASPSDYGIDSGVPPVAPSAQSGAAPTPAPTKSAKAAHPPRPKSRVLLANNDSSHRAAPASSNQEPAWANTHGFGLGVILGEPTGITAKIWTGSNSAFDLGTAYSFHSYFLAYADMLWHFDVFPHRDEFTRNTRLYVGAGGGMYVGNNFRFNVRVPVGLEWAPAKPRLGVFAELVPAVRVIPNVTGDFAGGIGVRYYF